jgi:hypothetical protein
MSFWITSICSIVLEVFVFRQEIHERNARRRNFFSYEAFTIWPALVLVSSDNFSKLIKCIGLANSRLESLKANIQTTVSYISISSWDKMDTLVTRGFHYKTRHLNLKVQVARRLSRSSRALWGTARSYFGFAILFCFVYSCVVRKGYREFGDFAVWLALQGLDTLGDEHARPHPATPGPDLGRSAMVRNDTGPRLEANLSHAV